MALAAPTNLHLSSSTTAATINLYWTNGSPSYDHVLIDRRLTGGSWSQIAMISGSSTTYQNTGLMDGSSYDYRVRGFIEPPDTEYSDYSNTATGTTFLPKPTGCDATCIDADSALITWEDNSQNESGFKIYKDGAYMVTVGQNVQQYQKDGLTPGATYAFKVKAYNALTDSAFSNTATVYMTNPPSKPTGLTAQPESSSTIRLNWTDNSNNETGFKIEESSTGPSSGFSQVATVGANIKTYLRTGRSSATQYWYKVRAYNGDGNSLYSNVANCYTYAAIAPPSNLVATAFSDTKIELTFQDNSDEEDNHRVERKLLPSGGYAEVATLPPNVTFYRDTGLVKGSSYRYQVRAFEDPSYSGYSNEAEATTISEPADPTGFSISEIGADYMVLTWTATTNETGYKIEKSLNGADYTEICIIGAGLERFKVFDLTASTHYWFKIRAYNAAGNSGYATADDDTTLAQYAETAFEKLLRSPNPELIYLCEVNPKMEVAGFTLTGGKTYTYEVPIGERGIDITSVLENGVAYTEKTSTTQVEATASTFYFDYLNRILYVHSSTGDDPVDYQILAGFWLYFTDYKTADDPAIYNGNNYLGLLSRDGIPDITHEISRYYESNYMVSSGRVSFINGKVGDEWYFDRRYALYLWENARLILRAGGLNFTYSQFEVIYTGIVKDRSIDDSAFGLDLRDLREGCERPLPLNSYLIETYPNLDESAQKDTKIPFYFGTKANVVPVCIDTVNKKFKLHDGRIKSVTSVSKKGETTLTVDTDYFIDYQNGVIMLARGYAWEDEDFLLVEFTGAVNSADEALTNGADIFKYICNNFLGLADTELSLDWLYYTKMEKTTAISVPIYQDISSGDLIRQIEQSIQAYSFQGPYGRIGLRPKMTAAPASARYVRNHHIFSHRQDKRFDDVFYKVTVYYNQNPQTGNYPYLTIVRNEAGWKYRTAKELSLYTFLTSESDAQALIDSLINDLDKGLIEAEISLLLLNVMPGDIIKYSRDRFFSVAGAASEVDLRILGIIKSPASAKTHFMAEIM